jgi:hypothetical protein
MLQALFAKKLTERDQENKEIEEITKQQLEFYHEQERKHQLELDEKKQKQEQKQERKHQLELDEKKQEQKQEQTQESTQEQTQESTQEQTQGSTNQYDDDDNLNENNGLGIDDDIIITRKNFVNYINKELPIKHHYMIMNILHKYNLPYTMNNNGVFINAHNLTDDIKDSICDYLYVLRQDLEEKHEIVEIISEDKVYLEYDIELNPDEQSILEKFKEDLTCLKMKKIVSGRAVPIKRKWNIKIDIDQGGDTLLSEEYLL